MLEPVLQPERVKQDILKVSVSLRKQKRAEKVMQKRFDKAAQEFAEPTSAEETQVIVTPESGNAGHLSLQQFLAQIPPATSIQRSLMPLFDSGPPLDFLAESDQRYLQEK